MPLVKGYTMSKDMSHPAARKAQILLMTGVVFCASSMAQAQDTTRLPTVYYAVSAMPVEAGRTGVSASVLTADDLARSPLRSLPLFLSQQAGVSAGQNGGLGATAGLRLRGLGGGYVAARLDGIDIADPTGTQVALQAGQIPTFGLDRVELVRGAQSAIHGSEAIGGVVALSTFRPQVNGLSGITTSEIASNSTSAASTAIGYRDDKTEAALTLSRMVSDGFSAMDDNDEADGFDGSFLSYRLERDLSAALRVGINGHLRDNTVDFDDSGQAEGNVETSETSGRRVFAALELGETSHELAYSEVDFDRVSTHWQYGPTVYDGSRRDWHYTGAWQARADLGLSWGFEDSAESYRELTGAGGTSHTRALFAEVLWSAHDALDLALALRQVDHDAFGAHSTWRLAALYRMSDALSLRAVASTGFTAPSPYQRFSESGQAGLTPETAQSAEVGLDLAIGGGATLSATLFDITITDRIDYVGGAGPCASSWGCYVQVAGETRSRGAELAAIVPLGAQWQLDANYTYTAAEQADGATLARVPAHSLNLGVTGQVSDNITISGAVQHVAGLEDAVYGAPNIAMPDYTLVHIGADYALSDSAAVYLQVQNLFDTDYQNVSGYNQAGRDIHLGLRTTF